MAAEADFTNWLEWRDDAALARVFDAIGGRLLLLAAHLAPRDVDARDLVQATFVAAMARGSTWDRQRPLWPWLATILHNEARMHQRRRRRHREVELGDVVEPRAADPASVVAADEAIAAVLAAIDSMPLNYRQVLRLRLVHGLQPIEIAQTMEIPVGTVRAQLHRGLERLRGTLPAGVATALAALFVGDGNLLAQARTFVLEHAACTMAVGAATTTSHAWSLTAILAMNMTHKMIGLGVGLALVAWLAFTIAGSEVTAQPTPTSGPPQIAHGALVASIDGAAAEPREVAVQRELLAAPSAAKPTAPVRHGRVLDSRGQPLADVPLAWVPFTWASGAVRTIAPTVHSDAQGRFELDTPTAPSVPAAGPGWCTLRTTPFLPESGQSDELLVVAAPAIELRGRTTRADDGTALADVRVQVMLLSLTEFPTPLDHTFVPMPEPARSNVHGEYRLADAPLAAGVELGFHRDGFTAPRIQSLDASSGHLDVVLVPANDSHGRVHGRVRDAKGPVAAVSLQLGFEQETQSDARGEFTFELPPRPSRLAALRRGWQPVVREQVGADTAELDLVFEREALTITGTLRLADGTPAPGWRIDIADPTRGYGQRPVELDCLPTATDAECLAITDADGNFTVGGLAERSYTLLAYEPRQLVVVTSAPIAAGTRAVAMTVPADACFDSLRGAVLDHRGAPVSGAVVSAWLSAASAEGTIGGPSATTAADGTFHLTKAPRRGVRLGVSKEGWLHAVQPIEAWTKDGLDLRIVLSRMCAVRVEGAADLLVQFLDSDGSTLHAECHSQTMVFSTSALQLHGGKSPVLSLPETTATMLWKRGDAELGRKAVFLDPTPNAVTLLIAGR